MTLFPSLGVAGISTPWPFRYPQPVKDVYKYSFFPQTIRDWNDIPESLISSSELSDDIVADRRLMIRYLIERFSVGYGTMHRILTEDLQMSKAILSYKFDFYMMHIAKVSDYSYTIVNRNNQ